ncbi:pyridoxal phosphate-dependent aminotransferase [Leptolyngbya sp. FACHB-261]|uniref:pyridoxal phosphate-dependent aminotransferase n=1 Tax=Leptolyngbya sp. FACHB-261 TaxID=2692806 RepID=UPI001681E664|nr:aminotransferase class I/II-fold pyridoxal phosphate-dependent enzyme [Leptolyngbya sp. FACHB-261]MBD2102200.1 aminotransferase class I/II-fold pyridoxal phosphate-dependent enzyme [Leptolyngbya sp. FACHB-261]
MALSSDSAVSLEAALPLLSLRSQAIQESQIREASRYCQKFGALNLAQGLPDFAAPEALKAAACAAIREDHNQYCDPWGLEALRVALAEKLQRDNGLTVDPETQITVSCGATEGLNLALMALLNPGDEVLIFEPFYENYLPNLATVGAVPRFLELSPPEWAVTSEMLDQVFSDQLKVVILNTPANPTGKVWNRAELELLAQYCQKYNVYVVTDEIYESIVYEGEHISLLGLPGMQDRTVLVNGFSKTFCVTGWRLGYTVASPKLTAAMRRIHDFLTICAPAPLQHAALAALALGTDYYQQLAADYRRKRDLLFPVLQKIGLNPVLPAGAYYIWTDSSPLAAEANTAAYRLAQEARVAAVPGYCFVRPQRSTVNGLRFCFAKQDSTLTEASERLLQFAGVSS